MAKPLRLDLLNISDEKKRKKHNLQYVVAVDDSNCSRNAFFWADFIANPKDTLTIMHSFDKKKNLEIVNERYSKYPTQNNKRYKLKILDDTRYGLAQRIKHYVNSGQKESVDLLVTGLWGKGFEDNDNASHIGSTSDLSLRSARCSSFFVRREICVPENQSDLKIVVGVDGSQNSLHAFHFATQLLAPNNSLYVIHVKSEYGFEDNIPSQYQSVNVIKNYTKYIEKAKKELGIKITMNIELIENTVKISAALCKYAKDNKCHILCVGADGMTAHRNKQPILGSVSDECVRASKCNIIVTQINEYNSTPRSYSPKRYSPKRYSPKKV